MSNRTSLQERMTELGQRNQAIEAEALASGRDLAPEEQEEIRANLAEFKDKKEQLRLFAEIEDQTADLAISAGRQTTPGGPDDGGDELAPTHVSSAQPRIRATAPSRPVPSNGGTGYRVGTTPQPRHVRTAGFISDHGFGDFLVAVRNARSGSVDPRLSDIRNQPAQFGSEGIGADGGIAVPPDFREMIINAVQGQDSLLPRTRQLTTSTNSITMPINAVAPWDNTQGITVHRVLEAGQKPPSKPALQGKQLTVHKSVVLVPVTDELLEDAPALNAYMNSHIPEIFAHEINDLLINGQGAANNEAEGIMNSGERIEVAAGGATAGTPVTHEMIKNMWSRMYAPWRREAVWLMHQDIEGCLSTIPFNNAPAASPAYPIFLPMGSIAGTPHATLMGRPIVSCMECQAPGTPGDIILWSPDRYLSVTRRGGIKSDVSIHVWFDFDITAFRFVLRIGGCSMLNAPITQRNGGNELSSIVTAETRP